MPQPLIQQLAMRRRHVAPPGGPLLSQSIDDCPLRLSSVPHLTLHPMRRDWRTVNAGEETLTVRLKHYVLPSLELIDLDGAHRTGLQALADAEPLALIDHWAVDPDYDGRVFRSGWRDHRGTTADGLRVVTQAELKVTTKPGPRTVCVRMVDVLGYEAEVVCILKACALTS